MAAIYFIDNLDPNLEEPFTLEKQESTGKKKRDRKCKEKQNAKGKEDEKDETKCLGLIQIRTNSFSPTI